MKVLQVLMFTTSIIYSTIHLGETCGGYNLTVDYFRVCGNESVITLSDDFKPVLYDNCTISLSYTLIKNNKTTYKGKKDLCEMLQKHRGKWIPVLDAVGAPQACPLFQGPFDGKGLQVAIQNRRILMPLLAGKTVGKIDVSSMAGNSCFEFSMELKKAKSWFSRLWG